MAAATHAAPNKKRSACRRAASEIRSLLSEADEHGMSLQFGSRLGITELTIMLALGWCPGRRVLPRACEPHLASLLPTSRSTSGILCRDSGSILQSSPETIPADSGARSGVPECCQ